MSEQIKIPDIGGASNVDVIEVLIAPGDMIDVETPLVTLEGDKASMDVPSPVAGKVESVAIKVGDKVSEGSIVCTVTPSVPTHTRILPNTPRSSAPHAPRSSAPHAPRSSAPHAPRSSAPQFLTQAPPAQAFTQAPPAQAFAQASPAQAFAQASPAQAFAQAPPVGGALPDNANVHASPSVRRLAHEVGVDLTKIKGTGEKGRITTIDLKNYVTNSIQKAESGFGLPPAPKIDFSKFGDIDIKELSKIQKASGANLSRNWISIPHVTQFIDADITELEAYRKTHKNKAEEQGFKLTPLVFIMKAVAVALKEFPHFNASLSSDGTQLILKKYIHIGVAVDTPNGLVVPVIHHVDQKDIFELAKELGDVSKNARDGKLKMTDMQGGCFSISSLGGIGGTAFTPIINAPEVAILGVSQASLKPVFEKDKITPRLMLPLSLSYDHRVIDGADGARFAVFLAQYLLDFKKIL